MSSRCSKNEIKPTDEASEAIYGLKPVSFRYKPDVEPACPVGFGLIAEDVEKVSPDLVVRDKEGKPYSARHDQVNAMLLNEFLKEHRRVKELEGTVAQQQKELEVLTSQFKQQAAQIQKVSPQLEIRNPAPELILTNQESSELTALSYN